MFKNKFRKEKNIPASDDFDLVCKMILNILSKDKINIKLTLETNLVEIGFDSIKYIQLMLNLEDIVDKDLEEIAGEIELSEIQNVDDVVQLIKKLKAK